MRFTCLCRLPGVFVLALFLLMAACGEASAGFPGVGAGTEAEPYEIISLEGLNWIRTDAGSLAAYYRLVRDLNFADDDSYDNPANRIDYTAGAGWAPIGSKAAPFTGNFDGGGYTIKDLTIKRSATDYVGLFGHAGAGGVIFNLGLIDIDVEGKKYVGGLVGRNSGIRIVRYSGLSRPFFV